VSVLPEGGVISFARGVPSPDMFPIDQLAICARDAVVEDGRVALNYGAPTGYPPLRDWIGAYHGVDADRVIVTPGSLIALNFLVRYAASEPGPVIVESPTYDRMLWALADAGVPVETVARSVGGLDIDRLRTLVRREPRPRFLYLLPTFHNPTGRTLTLAQRSELADLAAEHQLLVFEDDPYGLLRVEGDQVASVFQLLHQRAAGDLAIFCCSFSKSVAPGLRVGYLVLPPRLVAPVAALAMSTYVSPPLLAQAQLHHFLRGGLLDPHLEAVRGFLRDRRDALLAVLDDQMPAGVTYTRPAGGYFLWLELPRGVDAARLAQRAHREARVAFSPGGGFHLPGRGSNTARLSFSFPSVCEIRDGATRLAGVLNHELAGNSAAPTIGASE
jgi:2-aminoadipate transaminase